MKKNKNTKYDPKADKMVRAIQSGDNVKAYKCLESLVKERMAKKIDSALQS
jgi:cell fate (sporulation/competence/biofilm development) regulator YmcA (YheA/YmcA/DUF963 family)